MIARVTLAEIDAVRMSVKQAVELFRDSVVPALREQEGYEGVYVLLSEEGKVLALTFWDSEEAAESSGVPTLKLKLFACTVSGALMAAAGAPMPMYLSFIEPASTFNLSYTVGSLGSAIIGGMSHWAGPIIGAILLGTLQQVVTVTISGEVNVLVVGVLLVVFVVIAPEGILGLFKRVFKKRVFKK